MEKLRIGVIGAGMMAAAAHIPMLLKSEDVDVVAVCRRDPQALAKVADLFSVPGRYTEFERMLDDVAMDGVVVSSPHGLHYAHTKAALERGLPVLTDKPLAIRADEAEELLTLATEKGLPLIVAFGPPYQPAWRGVREWIATGELGQIEVVQQVSSSNVDRFGLFGHGTIPSSGAGLERFPIPPTAFRGSAELGGGGYFQDVGSHTVGGFLVSTDLVPEEVSATMDNPEVDLRAAVTIRCARGALVTLTVVADTFLEEEEYRGLGMTSIVGSRGSVSFSGGAGPVRRQRWGAPAEEIGPAQLPPAVVPAQHFVEVLRGRAQPIVPLEDAVLAVRVIEAAYRSAREQRSVRLK
jgi:predicted dehydrogenase